MIPLKRRSKFLPDPDQGESTFIGDLLRQETVGGAIVLVAAVVAVLWANSPIGDAYEAFRHWAPFPEIMHKGEPVDMEHWAADGALTLFFFTAGLELKREFLVGSLSKPADALMPIVAAMCGVAVPAIIFTIANFTTGDLRGWAIPAATDIAFALAVLAVVGSALPTQLRAFLLTLAVVDDLIVIVIIAIFYTSSLDVVSLLISMAVLAVYAFMQQKRVRSSLLYIPLAVTAWWFMFESGIHATIAGVALGLLTRVRPDPDELRSPAERLEHRLVPLSAGVAVPFFALMSAGVVIDASTSFITDPVVIGVFLGLVIGKPVGVMLGTWTVTRFTHAELNEDVSWKDILGLAILAGIGFTVALLVADLSYGPEESEAAKTAVLLGSVTAATIAGVLLRRRNNKAKQPDPS
ncbi:MAG TPA: Na+/H+ antiporter NhaA [Nocardioidaceae bacterium]|nr:Na+/H+ antiporter NhaA [Nocardioidaceae bacterium]